MQLMCKDRAAVSSSANKRARFGRMPETMPPKMIKRDTLPNAIFRNQLTQPNSKHRPADHRQQSRHRGQYMSRCRHAEIRHNRFQATGKLKPISRIWPIACKKANGTVM